MTDLFTGQRVVTMLDAIGSAIQGLSRVEKDRAVWLIRKLNSLGLDIVAIEMPPELRPPAPDAMEGE